MTLSPRLLTYVFVSAALIGCAAERVTVEPAGVPRATPSAALVRCTMLIPLRYNDGAPVPEAELRRIEDLLFDRFGGYTLAGRVRGAYRMADGTRADDESLVIWVAVPPARVEELRAEAARIAARLRQEAIYFERSAGQIDFVSAGDGGDT